MILIAFPIAASKSAQPLAVIFLNSLLITFGPTAVAARGMGSRLDMLFYLPAMSLIPATITLTGRFEGAGNRHMVKTIICRISLIACVTTMTVTVFAVIFPSLIWGVFTNDIALRGMGSNYLRVFSLSYPLAAIDIVNNAALQGLGVGYPTLIITLIRIWLVSLPLSYVFTSLLKMEAEGVWLAFAIGNLIAVIVSSIWITKKLNSN